MAKKTNVNDVQNGDVKSNVIVLRSVYGKVGQKYYIQPHKDARGSYPKCVKKVNSQGDMIMSDAERNSGQIFIPENQTFLVEDGKTYNLDIPEDAAEWEAIKFCPLIVEDRFEKDDNGNYKVDGTTNFSSKQRYGRAELYVDKPGIQSERKMSKARLKHKAISYIIEDSYDHKLLVCKVFGRNMTNLPNADVEAYLLDIAEATPDKIIQVYTGGDLNVQLLFISAKEKGVIYKKNGLYLYGEDGSCIIGASDSAAIEWLKASANQKTVAIIRRETFPELTLEANS